MSGFQLDTSGYVGPVNLPNGTQALAVTWGHLTPFAQGYVKALFASIGDVWTEGPFVPLSGPAARSEIVRPGFRHLAPATLARIIGDCERWRDHYPNINQGEQGGAQFWRFRTEQMVERPAFPPLTPYLGDDGLIYFLETNP